MKNLILTLIITLPLTLLGQGWEQTFTGLYGQEGSCVQQTSDGGYIVIGYSTYGNVNGDIFLIKVDNNGVEQWNQTFGGSNWDQGHSVKQTSDGGYILCGKTHSFNSSSPSNGQIYLIKTDNNGVEQWNQTFGDVDFTDVGNSVQQTNDGGYIITGIYSNRVGLIKTNEYGDTTWTKKFGFFTYDTNEGNSVQQTSDGGYIICGTITYGVQEQDVFLVKTNSSGDSLWTKKIGGVDPEKGESIQQTTDGGYIICGSTRSYGNGSYDVYVVKTDLNGNEQWSQTFGGINTDYGYSIQQTIDGGYIITGDTESFGDGYEDVYLIKTDSNGNEEWSRTFGGTEIDRGNSVQQTTDGGYIITGETRSFGNSNTGIYLIKTDDQGNITSTFEIPLTNPNRKLEKTVNLKGQKIKPQTGQPIIEIFDDGSVEKKLIIEK